jgi:hypothetical protein
MMTTIREVSLSPAEQGSREEVYWKFDFTKLGTPTGGSGLCYLTEVATNTDVGASCLKDSVLILGNIVSSKCVYNLTEGKRYKLEVLATVAGNIVGGYMYIDCI